MLAEGAGMTSDEEGSIEVASPVEAADGEPQPIPLVMAEGETVADVSFVVPATVVAAIATDDTEVLAAVRLSSPLASAIDAMAASLGKRLDTLQSVFDREIRAEATREKVVDRLHAELQEYKNDLLLKLLRPVFVDLIQLHDDIGKIVAARAETEGEAAGLVELMRGFQQGIEDILYRQGVEPFQVEDDAFDPRRQRAFSTQVTDDPTQAKKVASRLRKGFSAGDKVIRPEVVSVFALKR